MGWKYVPSTIHAIYIYNMEIIIYLRATSQKKITFSLLGPTWHLLEVKDQTTKIKLTNKLHFKKLTFNLLLQCKFWNVMHINEEVSYL
jgi:hypothetical protein